MMSSNESKPVLKDALDALNQALEIDEQRRIMLSNLADANRSILSRISGDDPRSLLQAAVESACQINNADCAVLYPYDIYRDDYFDSRFVVGHGLREDLSLIEKPRKTLGMAAYVRQEKLIIRNDIGEEDPQMLKSPFIKREGIEAFVGISLEVDEKHSGVLYINFRTPHTFEDYELEIYRLFADQLALALSLSKSYLRRADQLGALNKIGVQATSSADFSLDNMLELFQLIQRQVDTLMDADNFYLALYNSSLDEVRFALVMEDGQPVPTDRPPYFPRRNGNGLTELIIKNRESMLAENGVEEIYKELGREDYVGHLAKSWIGAPLILGEEVLGAMATYNWHKPKVYDEEDLRVLETIATQAATAIHIAGQFEQLRNAQQQLETARNIGKEITSEMEPLESIDRILEELTTHFGCKHAIIQIFDENTGELEIFAQTGLEEGRRKYQVIPASSGITGRAVEENTTIRVGDVSQNEGYLEYIEGVRSEMATPLREGDRIIGVLDLEHTEFDAFNEYDESLLELVAEEVVIALQYIRFITQLHRHQEREQFVNLGIMAGGIAHRIGGKTGLIGLSIAELRDLLPEAEPRVSVLLDEVDRDRKYLAKLSKVLFVPERAASFGFERLVVDDLLVAALADLEFELAGVEVIKSGIDDLPEVKGNKYLVEVFAEIMRNAARAMEESAGKILRISGRQKGRKVQLTFEDTGCGMSEEELVDAFKLFYSGSSDEGHSGFGLWMVKSVVSALHGDVVIESTGRDRGATCIVSLPI